MAENIPIVSKLLAKDPTLTPIQLAERSGGLISPEDAPGLLARARGEAIPVAPPARTVAGIPPGQAPPEMPPVAADFSEFSSPTLILTEADREAWRREFSGDPK